MIIVRFVVLPRHTDLRLTVEPVVVQAKLLKSLELPQLGRYGACSIEKRDGAGRDGESRRHP